MKPHPSKSSARIDTMFRSVLFAAALLSAPAPAGTASTYPDAIRQFHAFGRAEAIAALDRFAAAGDARAQFFLGSEMLTGEHGVPVNRPEGLAWLQIAAAKPWGAFG